MSLSRSCLRWIILPLAVCIAASATGAESPLADAVEQGDAPRIRTLLDAAADVNQAQADGMTPLLWAVERDDLATARGLIAAGADVSAANHYGVRPLSVACEHGNETMVGVLLDAGADPRTSLPGNETALHTAARTGRLGCVEALIARGATVDATERRGQTPLMWAAAEGHAPVVARLLTAGANLNATLPSGFNALFFATREGRDDVVRVLLDAGADVNAVMKSQNPALKSPARGYSPLLLAVENGHFQLAATLLDAGADPNDQRSGFTPLHMLTWVRKPNRGDDESGNPPPIGSGSMSSLQFLDRLVVAGANVNARLARGASGRGVLNRTGASPFLLACMTADVPLMRALLNHGADPRLPNASHSTPLMAAAGLGCLAPGEEAGTEDEALEALRITLELGNDINAVDDNGETAMHSAAYKNFPRVVRFLDEHGADFHIWNHADKYGWTPLSIAEGYRPGNFKPAAETLAALKSVLRHHGVEPPASSAPAQVEKGDSPTR